MSDSPLTTAIISLREQGFSFSQIAKKLGIRRQLVSQHWQKIDTYRPPRVETVKDMQALMNLGVHAVTAVKLSGVWHVTMAGSGLRGVPFKVEEAAGTLGEALDRCLNSLPI